jgi:hypothetical protein
MFVVSHSSPTCKEFGSVWSPGDHFSLRRADRYPLYRVCFKLPHLYHFKAQIAKKASFLMDFDDRVVLSRGKRGKTRLNVAL